MKLDPEETILLTQEEYERMLEIIEDPTPPEITPHMALALKRYRERTNND